MFDFVEENQVENFWGSDGKAPFYGNQQTDKYRIRKKERESHWCDDYHTNPLSPFDEILKGKCAFSQFPLPISFLDRFPVYQTHESHIIHQTDEDEVRKMARRKDDDSDFYHSSKHISGAMIEVLKGKCVTNLSLHQSMEKVFTTDDSKERSSWQDKVIACLMDPQTVLYILSSFHCQCLSTTS